MKLNLPISLRQSLLACLALAVGYTMCGGSTAIASDYVLDAESTLSIDYADAETILDLSGGSLQLMGNTELLLSGCGAGDGRVYTLATGVSELRDAEGNPIVLTPSNNAASQYFDTTQPGTGFWADATLQLTTDGALQLVRHNEPVKDAVTITTQQAGSADYQYYEGVSFKDINSNGGAIDGYSSSTITLSNNGSVTFSGNTASSDGGAISGSAITITLSDNGSVTFSGNTASSSSYYAYAYGGAIYGRGDSTITLSGNGSVTFSGNTASSSSASSSASGGAIYGDYNSTITLSGNGSVTFSGNTASSFSSSSSSSYVSSFAYGGAIYGRDSTITLSNNGSVTFSENTASSSSSYGGAIYGYGSTITLSNNGSVTFSGNTASSSFSSSRGGAISGGSSSTITLSNNGSVTFSGNTASSYGAEGGAIYGHSSTITLSDNESVTFSGNTASSDYSSSGGAIFGFGSTITLSNNGSVTFSENTASSSSPASRGGAIYGWGSTITLSNNGRVTFSGNTASSSGSYAEGGAIYSYGSVIITGNDEVTFAQNLEKSGTAYRLRSLYLECYDSTDKLTLSAGEKQSIHFYDSVYMGAKGSVALNADYTDAEGVTRKATGTILFSGATTEDDLKAAKGGVAGTEAEILNSRTSEIKSAATLYGGTLQVQDKAVLKLNGGLTVAEGSKASVQVQAAELCVGSHALNMVSGSSLELSDGAKLTATELTITTGATLAVRGSVSTAPLTATVAALTLSDETVAGFDASRAVNTGSVSVLEGDLTLEGGSLLSFEDAYLELTGDLFFALAGDEAKIELDIAPGVLPEEGKQVVLFNVGGVVTFTFDGLTGAAEDGLVYSVRAMDYFFGSAVKEDTRLVYDSGNKIVYLENYTVETVPEPTTSLLSLMGLVAFTLRRRRK